MIKASLQTFVDQVLAKNCLEECDVKTLQRDVFPDGLMEREEADVLIALDRAVGRKDPAWADCLVAMVAAYAVWTARPTGLVDAETAGWLAASLACGDGPTETAARIASEIVHEAQQVDEALLAFVMRTGHGRPSARERSQGAATAA